MMVLLSNHCPRIQILRLILGLNGGRLVMCRWAVPLVLRALPLALVVLHCRRLVRLVWLVLPLWLVRWRCRGWVLRGRACRRVFRLPGPGCRRLRRLVVVVSVRCRVLWVPARQGLGLGRLVGMIRMLPCLLLMLPVWVMVTMCLIRFRVSGWIGIRLGRRWIVPVR